MHRGNYNTVVRIAHDADILYKGRKRQARFGSFSPDISSGFVVNL